MNKLCFILPYYGPFPWWTRFFLESIKSNPQYNWLIISNTPPSTELPLNVQFLRLSFTSLKNLISTQLKLDVNFQQAYKLCDFKPAFGEIFSEYLKEYEYWGYCDLDVIFGNLDSFLGNVLELNYDIISPEKEFFPGHFCVFRNNKDINSLFKRARNYKEVFTSSRCYFFDEYIHIGGVDLSGDDLEKVVGSKINKHRRLTILKNNRIFKQFKPIISKVIKRMNAPKQKIDFNGVIWNEVSNGRVRTYNGFSYKSDVDFYCKGISKWNVNWKEGFLSFESENILYFHFQLSKKMEGFKITEVGGGFCLTAE